MRSSENRPRRRRRRWLVLAVLLGAPVAFVSFAMFVTRFQPLTIPPDFTAPAAPADGPWVLRYTGISGYELSDGNTVVLMDPVITRPTVLQTLLGPVQPNDEELREVFPRASYILVNHAHHDHGADAPSIALRTGATIVGGTSMINLARSRGVPESQLKLVKGGEVLQLGTFTVRVAAGEHSAIMGIENPLAGVIPPDAGPLRLWQYAQDGVFAFHLQSGNHTLLFHPTSRYRGAELPAAQVIIYGLAGEDLTAETMAAIREHTRPAVIIPTHFDNFLQPRSAGLSVLPLFDLDAALGVLRREAGTAATYLLDYEQRVQLPPDPNLTLPSAEP